jgi:tRNA/tmRNA/rRNA uracil-C5-methylase (TrmA/RlmC/RlmD family)
VTAESRVITTLKIDDVAFGGAGVGRHEGKACFVPFTIPGETVTARIVREKKKFAEAELTAIEVASPHRVEPRCPYFGRCGGCAYQHMTYEEQLRVKHTQVEQTLRRVGRLEAVPMRPIVAAPESYGYRNRIRVHAAAGVIGFYAHRSQALIDIAECPISTAEVNQSLARLRRSSPADGDYTVAGQRRAGFFEQTNDAVARLLVETVRATLAPGQGLLIDAYCGAGLFAHALRDLFEQVIGIEENAFAVEQARREAAPHERFLAGDVSSQLGELLTLRPADRTTVILDPPAIGVSPRVLDLLSGSPPGKLLYVSCNPATLARDLASLCRGPFRLESVTPLDMFPQTAEIEVVAEMRGR